MAKRESDGTTARELIHEKAPPVRFWWALLLVPLLTYLRMPPEADLHMALVGILLSTTLFILLLPPICVLSRLLFGVYWSTVFVTFFALLALAPYRFLLPDNAQLCHVMLSQQPTFLGLPSLILLPFFLLISITISKWIVIQKGNRRRRPVPSYRRLAIYSLLALLALSQTAARYGSRSPKSVQGGWHKAETPYERSTLEGVRYGGWDHPHWIDAAAMFRSAGTPSDYKGLVDNRRAIGPYLHSLFSPYLGPYGSAVAVNFGFFYLILACGFDLARRATRNTSIAVGFSVLLSANHFLLWRTITPYFYIQYTAAFIFIPYCLMRLRPFDHDTPIKKRLMFLGMIPWIGLTYDSLEIALVLFLCGAFRVYGHKQRLFRLAIVLCVAATPLCVQKCYELLLHVLHVSGSQQDIIARQELLSKLQQLPAYLLREPWDFITTADRHLSTLVLTNRLDTGQVEYWSLLGILGFLSFFALAPRYLKKMQWWDLLLACIAAVSVRWVFSMAANLPPLSKFDNLALDAMRSNSAFYPMVVIAQAVALYHFSTHRPASSIANASRLNRMYVFFALIAIIWVLSFGKLLFT